mgnify:CR=1 FL=1
MTATDRNGVVRTDGRKLFEVIGMSVMVITFYFLTITGRLSEWYVLIFAVSPRLRIVAVSQTREWIGRTY